MSHPATVSPMLIAHLLNLVGGGVIWLVSWVFSSRFPTPFFRTWTIAFSLITALLACEFWGWLGGRTALLSYAEVVLAGTAGAFLFATAAQVRGAAPFSPRLLLFVGAIMAAHMAVLAAGVPHEWAIPLSLLVLNGGTARLGWALLRELPAGEATRESRRAAWAALGIAVWPFIFPYPLFANGPYGWCGYAVSGLLQLGVGLNMLIYAVDRNWARFKAAQEEVARHKSEFVSIVSHELRSPLTTVIGYSEFLEEELEGPLTAGQRAYVDEIQRGGRRLRRLVDDLLDFSLTDGRTIRVEHQEADLAAKVRTAVAGMQPQAQTARIALKAEVPEGPLRAWLDADRFEQVVMNLVGNAIKFTPAEGRITVKLAAEHGELMLQVCDTGQGIDAADLPHLFEKFYQAGGSRRMRGGAGLGLAITKAIIESHGGTITVDSQPGEGTCFVVRLPHRLPPAEVAAETGDRQNLTAS